MKCFEILCDAIQITPSPIHFFYLYDVDAKSLKSKVSVSLKPRPDRKCLNPFKSNAKTSFTRKYFRMAIHHAYPELFTLRDGTARFPIYWIEKPNGIVDPPEDSLTAEVKTIIIFFAQLPVLDCAKVIEDARHSKTPRYLGLHMPNHSFSLLLATIFIT